MSAGLHFPTYCDEHHDLVRDFGGPKPEIVVLCGSTRFKDEINATNARLTLEGKLVISLGVFGHVDLPDHDWTTGGNDDKRLLDDLHKRKIDLADRVFIVNPGGYIGESTRSEIEYAEKLGKPVEYLEPVTPEIGTDVLLDSVDAVVNGPYGNDGNIRLIGRPAISRIVAAIREAGVSPTDDDSRAAIAQACGYPGPGRTRLRMVEMVAAALAQVEAARS